MSNSNSINDARINPLISHVYSQVQLSSRIEQRGMSLMQLPINHNGRDSELASHAINNTLTEGLTGNQKNTFTLDELKLPIARILKEVLSAYPLARVAIRPSGNVVRIKVGYTAMLWQAKKAGVISLQELALLKFQKEGSLDKEETQGVRFNKLINYGSGLKKEVFIIGKDADGVHELYHLGIELGQGSFGTAVKVQHFSPGKSLGEVVVKFGNIAEKSASGPVELAHNRKKVLEIKKEDKVQKKITALNNGKPIEGLQEAPHKMIHITSNLYSREGGYQALVAGSSSSRRVDNVALVTNLYNAGDGTSLRTQMNAYCSSKRMSEAETRAFMKLTYLQIFSRLSHGIEFLHQHGIVHHDIKPQNIFVNFRHGQFTANIADLASARFLNEDFEQASDFNLRACTQAFNSSKDYEELEKFQKVILKSSDPIELRENQLNAGKILFAVDIHELSLSFFQMVTGNSRDGFEEDFIFRRTEMEEIGLPNEVIDMIENGCNESYRARPKISEIKLVIDIHLNAIEDF